MRNYLNAMPLRAVDFARSSCGWALPEQPSSAAFGVDAVMTVHGPRGDEVWVLSSQVPAGDVYGDGPLFKEPPYGFSLALGAERYRIFRDAWRGPAHEDSFGPATARFRSVHASVCWRDADEVPAHVLLGADITGVLPLSARVALPARPGLDAMTLEFPVRHINANPVLGRFQAETGPVLLAVPGTGGLEPRLRRAWVMFGRTDRVEFLMDARRPAGALPWGERIECPCTTRLLR